MRNYIFYIVVIVICIGCESNHSSYKNDIDLLKKVTNIIQLQANNGKAIIAISPEYQGKIITSTFGGENGLSNGWINYDAFKNETVNIGGVGGEDRVWLTPLGSQFSFYYQQIKPLNEDNWKVPEVLSSTPFKVLKTSKNLVSLLSRFKIQNFIGAEFNIELKRNITLFEKNNIEENLNISIPKSVDFVAFESAHELKNIGKIAWKKSTGLAGIWSAGMYRGTENSVVIIPLKNTSNSDDIFKYMGSLGNDRFKISDNVLLFKTDGKYRSKIGVPNNIAPSIYGCYSKELRRLTIIQFKKTQDNLFSNSHPTIQEKPFNGEVIPIYNNGTMDYSRTDEVSFYELETVTPFKELAPNETLEHFHRVYHFSGSETELNVLAKSILGVKLNDCTL